MKKFMRQDYYKFKRLKRSWRRPKGMHSKMRVGKCGSGVRARIGHSSPEKPGYIIVKNMGDINNLTKGSEIIISSNLGSKKTMSIVNKAKEIGLKILNMKKPRRAEKIAAAIEKKRQEKKLKEKSKAEKTKKEKVKEKTKVKAKPEASAKEKV